ncbi:hypothetical protein VTP01DRAFT_6079 [Rhizomucor pusillus]|uniref:uncharacterized protein n=1 Tax=Rhizomucor pusillus TaxID=4840 RepID=UPI0037439FA4
MPHSEVNLLRRKRLVFSTKKQHQINHPWGGTGRLSAFICHCEAGENGSTETALIIPFRRLSARTRRIIIVQTPEEISRSADQHSIVAQIILLHKQQPAQTNTEMQTIFVKRKKQATDFENNVE